MLGMLARLGHVLYWFGCIAAVIAGWRDDIKIAEQIDV
jgi:hypothetical protein